MKEAFVLKLSANKANTERLHQINSILADYKRQGYVLTLRQLYYQLVSRAVIPNNDKEYSKLSTLLTNGRMAGIVDWAAIEDRVRVPKIPYYVTGIRDALNDTYTQYRLDRQKGQEHVIEVWLEKDALSSIVNRVTREFHIRLMVNRGYSSSSAMYAAYNRFIGHYKSGAKNITILYLGDHDPSGMDMIRDVRDRVTEMFINGDNCDTISDRIREFEDGGGDVSDFDNPNEYVDEYTEYLARGVQAIFTVKQIALNMQQVRKYKPPVNPAKITDPRAKWYIKEYGQSSWELDALQPAVLEKLCRDEIMELIDFEQYKAMVEEEERQKKEIYTFMEQYDNEGNDD